MIAVFAVGFVVDIAIQQGADTLDQTITKEFEITAGAHPATMSAVKVGLPTNSFKLRSSSMRGLVGTYEASTNTASLSLFEKFMRPLIYKTLRLVPHFCLGFAILGWLLMGVLAFVDRVSAENG